VHDDKLHFVEEVGHFLEHSGLTRMAGRMLGWLLICDPPHQTMPQIAEAVQASKGSISSASRLLIRVGLVERFSLPGERRDYYRLRFGAWDALLAIKLTELARMREIAERGLAAIDGAPPAARQRLDELREMAAFLEREYPRLLARWQQERAAHSH
jgi:DNA-binding transcriptional regulator GbsR (MarR family)